MGWLDDQVALVTGGASGIGRGIVARFLEEGARVGVLERLADRVQQLRADFGKAVCAVQGDVTSPADNQRAVADTVRAFGHLDIFVGNAGVFDRFVRLDEIPEDKLSAAFDEQFGVNVNGGRSRPGGAGQRRHGPRLSQHMPPPGQSAVPGR